jgi:hypothetical protein
VAVEENYAFVSKRIWNMTQAFPLQINRLSTFEVLRRAMYHKYMHGYYNAGCYNNDRENRKTK